MRGVRAKAIRNIVRAMNLPQAEGYVFRGREITTWRVPQGTAQRAYKDLKHGWKTRNQT